MEKQLKLFVLFFVQTRLIFKQERERKRERERERERERDRQTDRQI